MMLPDDLNSEFSGQSPCTNCNRNSLNSSNGLNDNNNTNKQRNWIENISLSDISVGEILDVYKNDTDLLKHILTAKTEEDKRRAAEEIRRAEEARLQSKFIDLQLDQSRRSSLLDDAASLGFTSNDWLTSTSTNNSNDLLSPFLNNTPPSPSQLQPQSPFTLFEVPFANLNLSSPSSPEPNNNKNTNMLLEKTSLADGHHLQQQQQQHNPPPPPATPNTANSTNINHNNTNSTNSTTSTTSATNLIPPPDNIPSLQQLPKERASCKRTLSRTRSTRKPSVKALSKKNRSSLIQQQNDYENVIDNTVIEQVKEELPLDHDKVMEALRAKLQRSTQQQKDQQNNKNSYEEKLITSMSPSGILLLDLRNPKKLFPVTRPKATPRASVVRKPNSFISAHKPKEQSL